MPKIRSNLDLNNAEIQNFVIQKLNIDPSPKEARLYFNIPFRKLRYHTGMRWEFIGELADIDISANCILEPNSSHNILSSNLTLLTLPETASKGSKIEIVGQGAGGWEIVQMPNQQIFIGNQQTTIGELGKLFSLHFRDSVTLKCVSENLVWQVIAGVGKLGFT